MYDKINETVEYIQKITRFKPSIAMILGSGMGNIADEIENSVSISYKDLPHFSISNVEGHANKLIIGDLCGKKVIVMQGRFHYYEGFSQSEITYPIRVFKKLGVEDILITNAAGGCNKSFKPGDLMIINDHINMSGSNPLIGPNDERIGPRFPDMTSAYNKDGIALIKKCASKLDIKISEGIYMFFSGPSYETPAEIKMASILGADAVGMSSVPEVIVARYCGMRVYGISCITNMAAGISGEELNHNEVIEITRLTNSRFSKLVKKLIEEL
ncbi:purine-nucleoside phosphorylase [Peptostreptococcus faecalis]|uniref:purine-nucleoside phosphorylase n=1 Tax=Peptostreptococcus faecalis TaxID=2045015 RepID=UPI0015E0A1A4|nr:purine-nucleoside phosphorylase [Peptostreptococcus faecalis]